MLVQYRTSDCCETVNVTFTDGATMPSAGLQPSIPAQDFCPPPAQDYGFLFERLQLAVRQRPDHAAASFAWERCTAALHRWRAREAPVLSTQSALDFAAVLNKRLSRAPKFTVHPQSSVHVGQLVSCCPRHRKALSAGLLAFVLSTPVLTGDGNVRSAVLLRANAESSAPYARPALTPVQEVRIILALKDGLRGATGLFGRFSAKAQSRNVATMTAGIRN